MADFCEQSVGIALLQLVSRAQAVIAELLRLSDHIPTELRDAGSVYAPLLSNFSYFRSPEIFEERIGSNPDLAALDDEFREKYFLLLERFFLLFNGIVRYYQDLLRYLEDLQGGVYIESTIESILHNEDGSQLLVEVLVLHGIILMLFEHRLQGAAREQILVAYFRCVGNFDVPNFDAMCTLCRCLSPPPASPMQAVATLFQATPLPVPATMLLLHRPEEIMSRFPLPKALVQTVVARLRTHDLYSQVRHYPNSEHRSTALLSQAASLYVLLFSVPQVLQTDAVTMNEIVTKFFKDFWVIPIFMGFTVDLSSSWERFEAAKSALNSCIKPSVVRELGAAHFFKADTFLKDVIALLSDGVLSPDYVVNNMTSLMSCLRNCNSTLRWLLLHRFTTSRKLRESVLLARPSSEAPLLSLLLDTAALEFELKCIYSDLLKGKEKRWVQHKTCAFECMQDLADVFSGGKALSRTAKDENLQQWFSQIGSQVDALDYKEPVVAGRKIQHMITALEEVEQFHQIEGSFQLKQCLLEARTWLQAMVRTLNVQESTLATISVVTDTSYAWGSIEDFTDDIHASIKKDPLTVSKLQCLFLKLRSGMDTPLLRLSQSHSADFESVSDYYSSQLVKYVREVLEIVPATIFSILDGVVKIRTKVLSEMPWRIEKDSLREYAKLDERHTLARATERVALFTRGILSMKKTFIGAIELDPRQFLEQGIRKQLAAEITKTLHTILDFQTGRVEELEEKLQSLSGSLSSQQQSMEYFQDYVHIHGLRLWQEEYTKIIHQHTDQECKALLKNKNNICDSMDGAGSKTSSNFMGRVLSKLLNLTNPSSSMYLAPMSGWFNAEGRELVGLRTVTQMQESMGPVAISSLDTLISFMIAIGLRSVISMQRNGKLTEQLKTLEAALSPTSSIPDAGPTVYSEYLTKVGASTHCASLVGSLAHVGRLQLIRCLLLSRLRAASEVESGLLSYSLEGYNVALCSNITESKSVNDVKRVLSNLRRQLQLCGICCPLKTIYVTEKAPDLLALLLFLSTLVQLPRYVLDKHLGTLTSRTRKAALDCCPLIVGFATLLQQFHPSYSTSYVQYLEQFVRTHAERISSSNETINKVSWEVPNALAWRFEFEKYAGQQPETWPSVLLRSFMR